MAPPNVVLSFAEGTPDGSLVCVRGLRLGRAVSAPDVASAAVVPWSSRGLRSSRAPLLDSVLLIGPSGSGGVRSRKCLPPC